MTILGTLVFRSLTDTASCPWSGTQGIGAAPDQLMRGIGDV